jgi:hypothetical protein
VKNGGKTVMDADRNARGRFLPGRPGGPGRPRRAIEAGHLAAPSQAVPTEVQQDIIAPAIDQARDGHRFRAVSQGADPCQDSMHNGPPSRLNAAPAVVGLPVPAERYGAPLDGHWRPAIARLPIAWRRRWANRAEGHQSAGLPRDLAEFLAYRWTVEEIAAV